MEKETSELQNRLALLSGLDKADADIWVGPADVAALTGYSDDVIRQRRLPGLPEPINGLGRLRWRLGDIRLFLNGSRRETAAHPRKAGRPTKKAQVSQRIAGGSVDEA